MNLYARFKALKILVPGNREKAHFEHTMGPSAAEMNSITGMSKWSRRILSEIDFAIKLSENRDHKYDTAVENALAILENAVAQEGVLTASACKEAEKALLIMQDEAKAYEVLYVAHAHIDMNWMWGWQETVAVTLSTFRTMLNLMKEYPDFTFAQSQASVYQIVEDHDPEMMEEIIERIKEGRWEVTANAWVETDKNMPDTESLIRHISETRKYLHEHWDVEPGSVKVDFSPDTFGHSRFIPEINSFGNVPYYYHCRGFQDDLTLYRYKAPSGKELLMYKEPYWYNSGINPDNGTGVFELEKRCKGLKTSMIVYGVGNHGGGATRRDIENMIEMKAWPVFPSLRFSSLHEYFKKAEAVREKLPVIDHELNAIFTGCYTTQSRIKLGNRRAESALTGAEKMSALAADRLGTSFKPRQFEKGWQKTLFCHFHDIITGSDVQESREHAMGRLAEAVGYAQTEETKAYESISRNIDTSSFISEDDLSLSMSEGAGVGFGIDNYAGVPNPERGAGKTRVYTVFNTSQIERREVVEITVWDYAGDLNHIEFVDENGAPVSFVRLDAAPRHYWTHFYTRFLIDAAVPAMGYRVYALREKEIADYPTHLLIDERVELPHDKIVLENEFIKATFDTGSGQMHSLINKETDEEMLKSPAGLNLIMTQDSDMSAWRIGRYFSITPVTDTYNVSIRENALRKSATFKQTIMHSDVELTVSLDKGAKNLHYAFKIDWHETCKGQKALPILTYRLPLKQGAEEILNDVPAGFALRPQREMDVPALTYACANAEGATAALITDCKYGFRLADDVLSVTLINTAGTPDLYPERGIHAINLYVLLAKACPACLKKKAQALTRNMVAVPTGAHEGALKPNASLMDVKADNTIVSAVRISKDNALTVRVFEMNGKDDTVVINTFAPVQKAVLTDLDENILAECEVSGETVSFPLPAYTIAQVKIYR